MFCKLEEILVALLVFWGEDDGGFILINIVLEVTLVAPVFDLLGRDFHNLVC